MANVLYVDSLFRQIHIALTSKDQLDYQSVTNLIGKFKKKISKKWLNDISGKELWKSLSLVIQTLLKYTECDSANVRVCAYGCLGSLLLSVVPFNSTNFTIAFGDAISKIDVNPKSSIAIINMFSYLSKFVLPANFQRFIILIPIVNHFKGDFSYFLDYMPKSITSMSYLPISLHKLILESIVNVEKNMSISFIKSIFALVSLNKSVLVPYLQSLLKNLSDTQVSLSIYQMLVTDSEIIDSYTKEDIDNLIDTSFKAIECKDTKYFEFESACYVLYYLLVYYIGRDEFFPLKNRIINILSYDFKQNYTKIRFILPLDFEYLIPQEFDSISTKNDRVTAICKYVLYFGEYDSDFIAKYFYELRFARNDLYCTLIDGFSKIINILFNKCNKNYHILLLEHIFERNECNWVHKLAVTNLISALDFDLISKSVPDIFDKSVKYLLTALWTPIKRLSESAIKSLNTITSYDTLHIVLSELYAADWLSENNSSNNFLLLASLSETFDSDLFVDFVDIAYECMLYCDTMKFLESIYKFLRNINVKRLPEDIIEFTVEFMISSFQNFTQVQLIIPDSNFSVPVPNPTLIDQVDTDIVVNPLLNHKEVLASVVYAYEFVTKNDSFLSDDDLKNIFYFTIDVIPLFGEVAIEKAIKIDSIYKFDSDLLYNTIRVTYLSSISENISAVCCKYLVENRRKLQDDICISIERTLINQQTTHPDYLLYCFIFIDQSDHIKAIQALEDIQSFLNPSTGTILMFKLMLVLSNNYIELVQDQFALALLMFANYHNNYALTKVRKYIQSYPFYAWNIDDKDLMNELKIFLENEPKVVVDNLEKLKKFHWEFIFDNMSCFTIENLDNFITNNASIFYKIKNVPKKQKRKFILSLKSIPDVKYSSISPIIKSGNSFIKSDSLILNFLKYSKIQISVENIKEILTYGISVANTEIIKSSLIFIIDRDIELDQSILENAILLELDVIPMAIKATKIKYCNFPESIKNLLNYYFGTLDVFEIIKVKSPLFKPLVISIIESYEGFIPALSQIPFKISIYKRLMHLFPTLPFDGIEMHDLISIHLDSYIACSLKKKALIIRFIVLCVFSLLQRQQNFEAFQIVSLVYAMFENISSFTDDSIVYEIFNLLNTIIVISHSSELYSDFISRFISHNGNTSFNMVACTLLASIHRSDVIHFSRNLYLECLENPLPSSQATSIFSLQHMIDRSANEEIIELITSSMLIIQNNIEKYIESYRVSQILSVFVVKLLQNYKTFGICSDFLSNFTSVILSQPDHPCFNTFLLSYPYLLKIYEISMESVFSIKSYSVLIPEVLDCFFEIDEYSTYKNTINLILRIPNINILDSLVKFCKKLGKRKELYEYIKEVIDVRRCHINLIILLYNLTEKDNGEAKAFLKSRGIEF